MATTRTPSTPLATGPQAPLRDTVELDGTWDFWPDLGGAISELGDELVDRDERTRLFGEPRAIEVPGVWQAQFDDLRVWSGTAWYERDFTAPASLDGRAVRLHFGAVDYYASVWLDGQLVAHHEGGYLPFHLDVTPLVQPGATHVVTVRVYDPSGGWPEVDAFSPNQVDDPHFPFHEIPHGKQSWYGPLGGLWQRTWVEVGHPVWVRHALLHGNVAAQAVDVRALLGAPATGAERLRVRITAPDGSPVDELTSAPGALEAGAEALELTVPLPSEPELWDVGQPNLYTATVELLVDDEPVDAWSDTFGFRTIAVEDGAITLNGRPFYMRGALDQDYYHETISTPPSDDLLEHQLRLSSELGLNLLRCHIKAPDPRYLYAADRHGMLVWQEAPNWISFTPEATRRGMETLRGMIERDFNHPSTIVWTIINESWGIDIAGNAEHRAWLSKTFDEVKSLDPTRLVVDNSPCEPSFHLKTDLNDFHYYKAVPEHADEWSAWTRKYVEQPLTGFSPHGDASPSGREPIIISEFGNWGLPDVDDLLDEQGQEPWWFGTGRGWTFGTVHPHGIRERYREWNFDRVFGSWREFVHASQEAEWEGLKYQIEDMRSHEKIAGYVVTELTDVHWESNGLLDLARNPKSFHDRLRTVNADDVVWARPERARLAAGDTLRAEVFGSCWSGAAADGATVRWRVPELDAAGELAATVPMKGVRSLGTVEVAVTAMDAPQRATLELTWVDASGSELNRNEHPFLLFPEDAGTRALPEGVLVADRWEDVADQVRAGGRAVVCLREADPIPTGSGLDLRRVVRGGERVQDVLESDWAQGMAFLAPELREGLPLGERVDITFHGLTPWGMIGGVDPANARDLLAGSYVGWLQSTAAAVLAVRHGDGIAIVTTFDLLQHEGDPLAESLLRRMVELAGDPTLEPGTVLE